MSLVRFLATFDGKVALELTPTDLGSASCSLQKLREVFFEQTGLDAYILHTGGLELAGQKEPFTVRLELAAPLEAASTAYPPLPHARPWQKPGWFRESLAWLGDALGERIEGLEPLSTSDLGTVLRVRTASRTTYFKTSERELEAALTAHIASDHPDLTPKIIVWDATRNGLLTEDCGSRLSETADLELWQNAVRKLAHFQGTANTVLLQERGCPVYPFDDLAERAAHFLQDERVLEHWSLTPKQIAALQEHLPAIIGAHERIEGLELPLLPSHGDAHPMNVLTGYDVTGCNITGRKVVWFDWSDAGLAHPLLDIGWFLAWTLHPGRATLHLHQEHTHAAERLWHTYLNAASIPETRMTDAMLLALTHRALVYHERYSSWQGTLSDWRPQSVPFLLRSLLRLPLHP